MLIIYGKLLKKKVINYQKKSNSKDRIYYTYYLSLNKNVIEGNSKLKNSVGKTLTLEVINWEDENE